MNPILVIIDDEKTIRDSLRFYFQAKGYTVYDAHAGGPGVEIVDKVQPDVVILDFRLADMTGMDVLSGIRKTSPDTVVIFMTAYGSISGAVEAVRSGAFDYLSKPVDLDKLDMTVERALEMQCLKKENRFLKKVSSSGKGGGIVGASPQIHKLMLMINLLAENSDTTVLIEGESGTGKEIVARAIHEQSRRKDKPFVEVNCASLSESLLESELFGHERGAFTDAKDMKRGLLEIADGGTLFLDEIGELSPRLQPKFLRMLETKSFRRVGGTTDIGFDVRFVAATNRSLADAVKDKTFREDLYYRLRVMPLSLPPLRERAGDVLLLARHFITTMGAAGRSKVLDLSPECEKCLVSYRWPGNVRELKNVIERAMILSSGPYIEPEHLPRELTGIDSGRPGVAEPMKLSDVEKGHILAVMEHAAGNQSEAARVLGISRSTLICKLKKYGQL